MANFSGLWNNEYGEPYSPLPKDVSQGNSLTALSKVFAKRIYGRGAAGAMLEALVRKAAGGSDVAVSTHKRVKAERDLEANVQGGDRVIETFTGVNRAVTNDDADSYINALELDSNPAPYPRDRSGNGGGNKLGW